MNVNKVLIIGGTGFAKYLDGRPEQVETGYERIKVFTGEKEGIEYIFISRHESTGKYRIPSIVPYRAHILAGKMMGANILFATTAVGSLKWEREDNCFLANLESHRRAFARETDSRGGKVLVEPGDVVLVTQAIDYTKHRGEERSFAMQGGMALHVNVSVPVCDKFVKALYRAAEPRFKEKLHLGGAYVCIEGPQFSTKAESEFYQEKHPSANVIGMTMDPEYRLTREMGMHAVFAAMVTDADNKPGEEVSHEKVISTIKTFGRKAETLCDVLFRLLRDIKEGRETIDCECERAPERGIEHYDSDTVKSINPYLDRVFAEITNKMVKKCV